MGRRPRLEEDGTDFGEGGAPAVVRVWSRVSVYSPCIAVSQRQRHDRRRAVVLAHVPQQGQAVHLARAREDRRPGRPLAGARHVPAARADGDHQHDGAGAISLRAIRRAILRRAPTCYRCRTRRRTRPSTPSARRSATTRRRPRSCSAPPRARWSPPRARRAPRARRRRRGGRRTEENVGSTGLLIEFKP